MSVQPAAAFSSERHGAHSHERASRVIEVSTHMNQDHWNKGPVYHKGLSSLYSSPFPPLPLPVSSSHVKNMAELVLPRGGGGYPSFRGGMEGQGKRSKRRFESESHFSRGIYLKPQAVIVKLLSTRTYLATCLRKLLPDLLSVHGRAWEEKQASECLIRSAMSK